MQQISAPYIQWQVQGQQGGYRTGWLQGRFNHVVDQTSSVEVDRLDQAGIDACYTKYDTRLGGTPPSDHEPTVDQDFFNSECPNPPGQPARPTDGPDARRLPAEFEDDFDESDMKVAA